MLSREAVGDKAFALSIQEPLEIRLECLFPAGKSNEGISCRGDLCSGGGS
jgi:hypothetical protein